MFDFFIRIVRERFGRGDETDPEKDRECCRSSCGTFDGRRYDKQYKIFKCPECRQKLRVPRHRGKVRIICCRCKREFIRRT